MRSHRRRLSFLPAALVGALALPATAAAGWTPPAPLTDARAVGMEGAAAPDGSAVLFLGIDGVSATVKMPGETFGPVQHLGPSETYSIGEKAKWVMDRSGRALVVWSTQHHVHAAIRQPGARTFTSLGSTRVWPDDPHIAPISGVAGALGAGGQIYLAWSVADTAHLAVPDGGGAFKTVASVRSPGGQPYSPAVAVAAAGDGSTAGMLTSGSDGTYWELTLTRWTATAGATKQLLGSDTRIDDGERFHWAGAGNLVGVSGDRATFFWTSHVSDRSTARGETRVVDEVRQLDLPQDGPLSLPTLPIRFEPKTSTSGDYELQPVVESAGSGVGALAIVPPRKVEESGYDLLLSRRANPATPFGALTSPLGPTRLASEYASVAPRGGGRFLAGFHSGGRPRFVEIDEQGNAGALQELPREWPEQQVRAPLAIGAGNGDTLIAWYAELKRSEQFRYFVSYDDATPPALSAAPTSVARDGDETVIDFKADAVDRWTPATVAWDFGDGTTATGPTARHRYTTAGPVRVTVTAIDAGGNAVSVDLRANSPAELRELIGNPASSQPPAGGSPSVAPRAAATLSKLRLARSSFVATSGKVKARRGTTLRFTLSAASALELRVSKLVGGRRSGKSCVTGAKAKRAGKRCTARRLAGTTTVQGRAGTNAVPFNGKLGRKLLRSGRYELQVTPVGDATRGKSAAARFTVTRR